MFKFSVKPHFMRKISLFLCLAFSSLFSLTSTNDIPENESSTYIWANKTLSKLTLKQKIAQFFMYPAYPHQGDLAMSKLQVLIKNNEIGGVLWFAKSREDYLKYADTIRNASESIPLFYAIDGEWGVSMRMKDAERFPYAYSIGAANDLVLSNKIASMMAAECRNLGFQFNFSPVADVNSNVQNPVIGFRSFGDDPTLVASQVETFVEAFEKNGVFATIKHFPGHGDTHLDSHKELPTIQKSLVELCNTEWIPFMKGINAGASAVMVGHLNVPTLDTSGTPSSLSKLIIQDYLKEKLGFKGLVVSDALSMKAVADKYGEVDVAVKAFEAGCDVLLYSGPVEEAIIAIQNKVELGEISLQEVNRRCLKILKMKEKAFRKTKKYASFTEGEQKLARYQVFEKSTTLLKNTDNNLPFSDLSGKTVHIAIGDQPEEFIAMSDEYAEVKHVNYSFQEVKQGINLILDGYERVIVTVHASTVRPRNNFGMPENLNSLLAQLNPKQSNTIVFFGNPLLLNNGYQFSNIQSLIVAYEDNHFVQNRVAQMLFGAIPFQGKLMSKINDVYQRGMGLETKSNGRLKFTQTEEVGVNPQKLIEIDSIILDAIAQKALPGCQIVAAVDGKIFFRKSYGTHQYDQQKVQHDDIYDIASITKIAASTNSLMRLQTLGKFSLDKKVKDYLPDLTSNYPFGNLSMREILAHQAGLKAWIPFYLKTIHDGKLDSNWYATKSLGASYVKVADGLYIKKQYSDSMRKIILEEPLRSKRYKYSDLGYYFIREIIQKQSGKRIDQFVHDEIYSKMGLHHTMYNPYLTEDLKNVVASEDDKIFRKQVVKGYVHDPGAAMLGGVGGHAGLFTNATELTAIMQLFLNKGYYGGVRYLNPQVVDEFTKQQFENNRRGAGFDKRVLESKGGPCDFLCSHAGFGHSGFTGTLAWADPKNQLVYVFLSNRTYPSSENKKLIYMDTRTNVQHVLNEALRDRK